jgi:Cu/Ag efflux protein CusF
MTTTQSATTNNQFDTFDTFDTFDDEDFLPVEKKSRFSARNISRGMIGAVALVLVFSAGVYAQRTWGDSNSGAGGMPNLAQGGPSAQAGSRTNTSTNATGQAGQAGQTTQTGQSSQAGQTGQSSNATTGTIKVVDGDSFYVTTSSGSVVKVTTNSTSTITRTASASVSDLKPGETVVVQGTAGEDGTVVATRVTDGSSGGAGGFGGGQAPSQQSAG